MTLSLIEDLPFPVFQLKKGKILYANQIAQEWTGDSAKRLKGKRLSDIIVTEPDLEKQIIKAATINSPITNRASMATLPNGTTRTCHITVYPVEGGTQGISFWSAGPRPREGKVEAPIVSGMGRLIAHELKNPLAGIKGASQLLYDDVKSEEGRALLKLIGSEIDRIRRLATAIRTSWALSIFTAFCGRRGRSCNRRNRVSFSLNAMIRLCLMRSATPIH